MLAPELVVDRLLPWFDQNARDLPWRRTQDPYGIWISEIMLQQTQVQTVIPYWERWMKELPDVRQLGAAPFARVLKLWEGLGYYTRARNLHRAAQLVCQEHNGVFPNDYALVLALPGIGRYTAGAICSIAFDQPQPILDGNIVRVITRVSGIAGPVRSKPVQARLWRLAQQLVDKAAVRSDSQRPCSRLNQALMELGATVCKPKEPTCDLCRLLDLCAARRTNRINRYPNLGKRPVTTRRRFVAFVVKHQNRVLVRQRPAAVVNAHLWEFPNLEATGLNINVEDLAESCVGHRGGGLTQVCSIQHTITRYRIRLDAYAVEARARLDHRQESGRWCTLPELEELAFPSAHRRILHAILPNSQTRARRPLQTKGQGE